MTSRIIDRVFSEVCLDERIPDGIFRMDEEQHMDALRDYFVRKGIPREAAINVTNRMVEGKYPERQAWRVEDGILVTWPSPKHKQQAMAKAAGKYTDKPPAKSNATPPDDEEQKVAPPGSKPEPGEIPSSKSKEKDEPKDDDDDDREKKSPTIFQGDTKLDIEPPHGTEQPPAPPQAPMAAPKTPQRIAAEKEVVKQIMATDDTTLSNVASPMNESLKFQLNELYKKADEMGFREAITFLTKYVKP